MATIKRTVSDSNGQFLYSNFVTHVSHASAAGRFQVVTKGSLILAKESDSKATVVKCDNGDVYRFEGVA